MWVDFPILNPYSSHMALPMWVQRGTMLQIPHESLMGCAYRTHINTHLWPMWVLYLLLAGKRLNKTEFPIFMFSACVLCFQRQPFRFFLFYFTAAGVKCRVGP